MDLMVVEDAYALVYSAIHEANKPLVCKSRLLWSSFAVYCRSNEYAYLTNMRMHVFSLYAVKYAH